MKLLICTQAIDKNDPILGFFHRWVEEFAKHFKEVHVICLKEGEHSLPSNVTVYSLGKEQSEDRIKYLFRFYKYFSRIFFTIKVDFVFFHMGAQYNILAAPFFLLREIFHTKFYWWKAHGYINLTGRVALLFVDKVFTASHESFPIVSIKKENIGHAIDTRFFIFTERELGNELKILYVGRIARIKKIEQLIKLASLLSFKELRFHITIVGITTDESYKTYLDNEIERRNLTKEISFVGGMPQDKILKFYLDSNLLLHASETGSIDKVVLEAMSCGLVPIALCPTYGSLLKNFNLCVENNCTEDYLRCIEGLIANKNRYSEIAHELRSVIVKDYSLDTLVKRIFNI